MVRATAFPMLEIQPGDRVKSIDGTSLEHPSTTKDLLDLLTYGLEGTLAVLEVVPEDSPSGYVRRIVLTRRADFWPESAWPSRSQQRCVVLRLRVCACALFF